ncbi:MAG: ADP-dependent glucokinase/phosphofructokinase [Methanotrichaceae archaeon]
MKVICAYNVNLDAVHNIKGNEIPEQISRLGIKPTLVLPEIISSIDDFFSALLFCMKTGSGTELLIDSPEVARKIKGIFTWTDRLGGNAGNMANAMAAQGAEPVLNVPALTKKLALLLDPNIKIPKKGNLVPPVEAIRDADGPVHFVLQFEKGAAANASGERIVSPRENRLIATYDELNGRIYTDPDFDAYCRDNLDKVEGGLVGGFHLVPLSDFRKLLDRRIDQIGSWKESRPDLFIHAEMGNFQRPEVMMYLLERLKSDSIGMNEDELATIYSFEPGWRGVLGAAQDLHSKFEFVRICIHTRDYILSVIHDLISPDEEVESLSYGADVAANLVATGKIMKPLSGKINPVGASAVEEFYRSGAKRSGRGAYLRVNDENICMVPSQLVTHPRITVGLGDVMTASVFYREVISRHRLLQ